MHSMIALLALDPFSQTWLVGSVLAVASSAIGIFGLVLQKKAQHRSVDYGPRPCRFIHGLRGPRDSMPLLISRGALLKSPLWWCGLLLVAAQYPLSMFSLTYAPETTVVSLGSVQVVMNFMLAYGLLNEKFKRKDILATAVCISGMVVAIASMPHGKDAPGYMEDFPWKQFLEFCATLSSNVGFQWFCVLWLVLFAVCVYLLSSASLAKIPIALPILVGLFTSQFHFVAKLAGTLMLSSDDPIVTYWRPVFVAVAAILYVTSVCVMSEGLLHLDCRFYVPATFAAATVMEVAQGLFFFREWQLMSGFDNGAWVVGCAAMVLGAIFVSPEHARVPLLPPSSPLLSPEEGETVVRQQAVLAIMEEYRVVRPQLGNLPLKVIDLVEPEKGFWAILRAIWRFVPIVVCLGVMIMCAALYENNYTFSAFFILTIWGAHNGWKYGLHMALFSYVGQQKMKQFDQVDFMAIYKEQHKSGANDPHEASRPRWEDVVHFVILPNYKEDMEVLLLAFRSVAKSKIAKKQIGLVLAMEAREEGVEAKAAALKKELEGHVRFCITTFHPPGIPGETPGKSSNTKWAARKVLEEEIPRAGLDVGNVVLTVADADSEFHPMYFEGLTYYFIHGGCGENETPSRYLTIWQPPILHYKNYHTQPVIVRLASLFTSQHELANLSDPNAVKVPYSTYSISATLATAVRGWDPDWISEDWHMGLKCFLATAGRIKIHPIFLAVMNYAPEGDTYMETVGARWTQAKRHALGFSEIVYFQDHFPRVLYSIPGCWNRTLFLWRAFWLWLKLLLIHLTMASMLVIGPMTGMLIAYFFTQRKIEDVNSWTFLTYLVFQFTAGISVVLFIFTNVLLYEFALPRIDGVPPKQYSSRVLHFLAVGGQSMLIMPFFFAAGGAAEWIAAIKCARTHKFQYDVASKPKLNADVASKA